MTLVTSYLSSASTALQLLSSRDAQSEAPKGTVSAETDSISAHSNTASRMLLSVDTIRQIYGDDSPILRIASGDDKVEIRLDTIPDDKESFRAEVIDNIGTYCGNDYKFFAAAKAAGTIEVFTADEVPELNMQSEINYTIYKNGSIFGSGGYGIPGQFNQALADEWGKSSEQAYGSVNGHLFYMRWPKAE